MFLPYANFISANFISANFISSNFIGANFIIANFISANFISANVISANFICAIFKTFQTYLAYALLGLFISSMQFLCLAYMILGLFISLLQFFGQKYAKNHTNEINSPKFALGINQIFAKCKIWLMRLFPRHKSHIRQEPSVHFGTHESWVS